MKDPVPTEGVKCSFCGKHQDEVRKIIAGPNVYICDECIDLCNDIIEQECEAEEGRGEPPPPSESLATSAACIVCCLPKPMEEVVPLPERGFICAGCVEAVRTAEESKKG
jgi:hypothetical protein